MQNLRWKIITIVSILIIFTVVGVYPILAAWKHLPSPGWLQEKQLKLGLDLKGGVNLEMRVQTDDALKLETDTESERLREELTKRSIPFTNITTPSVSQFRIEGVPPAQDAPCRQAA